MLFRNLTSVFFATQILVKVPVPLWVPSSTARGASQRLLSQCSQYFHLRCRLLSSLTSTEQRQLGLDASSMLRDEVAWLSNFSPYAAAGGGGGRGGGGAGGAGWIVVPASARASILIGARARASDAASEL